MYMRSVYIVLLMFAVTTWMLASDRTEGYIDWQSVDLKIDGCVNANKTNGKCPMGTTWDKAKNTCNGCQSMGTCTYDKRTSLAQCNSPFGKVSYNLQQMSDEYDRDMREVKLQLGLK